MKMFLAVLLVAASATASAGTVTLTYPADSPTISGKFTANADGSVRVENPMLIFRGVMYYINGDGDYKYTIYGVCALVGKKTPSAMMTAKASTTSLWLNMNGSPYSVKTTTSYTIGSITCA